MSTAIAAPPVEPDEPEGESIHRGWGPDFEPFIYSDGYNHNHNLRANGVQREVPHAPGCTPGKDGLAVWTIAETDSA